MSSVEDAADTIAFGTRTAQTAQRLTIVLPTMYLARLLNMSFDDWWLHVYVMLSRVRTAEQILVCDLPPREVFEQGPPAYICEGIERLEALGRIFRDRIVAARRAIGWAAVGKDGVGYGEEGAEGGGVDH